MMERMKLQAELARLPQDSDEDDDDKKLPAGKVDVKPKKKEGICPICKDEMYNDDSMELSCGHRFHYICICSMAGVIPDERKPGALLTDLRRTSSASIQCPGPQGDWHSCGAPISDTEIATACVKASEEAQEEGGEPPMDVFGRHLKFKKDIATERDKFTAETPLQQDILELNKRLNKYAEDARKQDELLAEQAKQLAKFQNIEQRKRAQQALEAQYQKRIKMWTGEQESVKIACLTLVDNYVHYLRLIC